MDSLGHPATWSTQCFIHGGCGADVFAHTNGYGDFVLFDELGPPWPLHPCYADRFLRHTGSSSLSIRPDRISEYQEISVTLPKPPKFNASDIRRVDPSEYVGQEILAIGYVQEYIERRADALLDKAGSLGKRVLEAALGHRRSQLTIVTSDYKSYTAFADLAKIVIQRKDTVCARIRSVRVLGIFGVDAVFLADDIISLRVGT